MKNSSIPATDQFAKINVNSNLYPFELREQEANRLRMNYFNEYDIMKYGRRHGAGYSNMAHRGTYIC